MPPDPGGRCPECEEARLMNQPPADQPIVDSMETIAPRFEWAMAFLAVAEHGSFTKAADALNCSKAYISKQVGFLEQALSVRLLHRTTRRVTPTEVGLVYLDYCRNLRETLSEAERSVSSLRDEVRGRIRMSVPMTFGIQVMSDLLSALHAAHPGLTLDLDLSADPRDLVAGRYDLALRLSPDIDPRLIAKPLGQFEDWVVAAPAVVASQGTPCEPGDLAGKPCLSNPHFADHQRWVFTRDGVEQAVTVHHWLRMNSFLAMRQAALAGLGYARLPLYVVERDVRHGSLVRVLADHALPSTPVYLVFPDQRPLPRKVRVAIDHVCGWIERYLAGQAL